MILKFLRGPVGERQVHVIASDSAPDLDGDVMVPEGCVLSDYDRNPIVLLQHDHAKPIGTADVKVVNGRLEALVTFAAEGVSAIADEACRLVKTGVLNAVSIGFVPLEKAPIPRGGWRHSKWKLIELSLVSVPANPRALVVQRGAPAGRGCDAEAASFRPSSSSLRPIGTLSPREHAQLMTYVRRRFPGRTSLHQDPKWLARQWDVFQLR